MDIITEKFCCDLDKCHGQCCVEGDAGAPVTLDEIMEIEEATEVVWGELTASAQSVIDKQGVSYIDQTGELVTSIVNNKDCVFTCHKDNCCYCVLEKAFLEGKTDFQKPISCALYPIREKTFSNNLVGLNYNKWDVCKDAVVKGRELDMPIYKFLRNPLIRRFGEDWYNELEHVVSELKNQGLIP